MLKVSPNRSWQAVSNDRENLTLRVLLVLLYELFQFGVRHKLRHVSQGAVEIKPGSSDLSKSKPMGVGMTQIGAHIIEILEGVYRLNDQSFSYLLQCLNQDLH